MLLQQILKRNNNSAMEKVINEKLINRNKTFGNVTSIIGIVILVAGLILNLTEPNRIKTLISFVALIIGVIFAQISTSYITRFGRNPRFDEVIADNLSKLNNDYIFYIYSGPVPMILVGPSGLWLPIAVSAAGEISFNKKWRQKGGSVFTKLFGQESIGRPEAEVVSQERLVHSFLKNHLSEEELQTLPKSWLELHLR